MESPPRPGREKAISGSIHRVLEGLGWMPSAARILLGLASTALLMALPARAPIAASSLSEQQMKAAFLVNFARYVKWPSAAFDSASDPIVIGIYGDGELPTILKNATAGRQVDGRSLEVVECTSLASARESNILFIGASQAGRSPEVIRRLRDASVFSVSDTTGFAKAGGVANFVRVGNKIRFEINKEAAKRAGLKLSSKLLRLAILVE